MFLNKWLLKPMLAIAVAIPVYTTVNVQSADAGHRYKRGAVIAGAIIGGALAYRHYRKHRKYRHYGYGYGTRHYRSYGYRKHRRSYYGHRKYRHYGGYPRAYMNSGIGVK